MRHVKMTYINSDGKHGFVPEMYETWYNTRSYKPRIGGISHDLFDHATVDVGTVEDELMALGAICYIFENKIHPEGMNSFMARLELQEHIKSDILPCPRSYKNPELEQIWYQGIELLREVITESSYYRMLLNLPSDLDEALVVFNRRFNENLINWVCRGFEKAKRRYRKHTPKKIYDMREVVDNKLKNFHYNSYLNHGDKVLLSYNFSGKVFMKKLLT